MKVYKSISPINIEHPYIFKETSQKVYSFEGLVHYCYNHWMEGVQEIENEHFVYFISEVLMLKEKYSDTVEMLQNDGKATDKLLQLLKVANMFTKEQLNKLKNEIDQWETQPINLRYKFLGDRAFNIKKYVRAIEYYKQAQTILFDPIVEHNIGIAYLKLYFFQEAEHSLRKAVQFSDKIEVNLSLIRLLKITNRINEALQIALKILDNEKSVDLLTECGLLYELLGQYEKSIEIYEEAWRLDHREEIHYKLMELNIEVNPVQYMLDDIENLPKLEQYYLLKAKILLKESKLDEAIDLLEEGVNKVDNNGLLLVILSKLYRKNKQIIKAIGAISLAAKNNPQNDEIIYEMAKIAKLAGNWTDYETKIDELLRLWKDDVRRRFSY